MTYDVVIYEYLTAKVTSVVDRGLTYANAEKLLLKFGGYTAAIVDAESVQVGEVVTEDVIR